MIDTISDFLFQALEELAEGHDLIFAEQLYSYIVERDGFCPYTIAEIEAWANDQLCEGEGEYEYEEETNR